MIIKIADNIFSPLGNTTEDNYQNVKLQHSASRLYSADTWSVGEPFYASLFESSAIDDNFTILGDSKLYTDFEKMCIISAQRAIAQANIDAASERVQFVISSTKGNVSLLDKEQQHIEKERVMMGCAATTISRFFGNPNMPLVISNACISGVCAQIEAMRCINSGRCDYAVVIGADKQCRFIVSGFQSFKALSQERCQPFDADRKGLNLGEAAGTIIIARKEIEDTNTTGWVISKGAIRNDANHISGPSRNGEGSYRALRSIYDGSQIAVINAHGTATSFNDEMESFAISRAGLSDIPVNSLKGYYGHTMGAAGIIEPILNMRSIDDGIILGTLGYNKPGTSNPLKLSAHHSSTERKSFIKLLSGFGGCNAAMLYKKGGAA
jgi:3-oxoacyl-[acyl-carrier-protein] synthase-1